MARKRKGISKRIRFEVFKRDAFRCQYCGRTPPVVILELDHIVAVASGGSSEIDNLIAACSDCNGGKSDRPLSQVPESLAASLKKKREMAEQVREYNRMLLELREEELRIINSLGCYWYNHIIPGEPNRYVFGGPRANSIRTFLRKLLPAEMFEAMDIALSKVAADQNHDEKAWRYFCGVCWRKIDAKENPT